MHTALMEASMDGHVEVARLLLDSGAQVSAKFVFNIHDVYYECVPANHHSFHLRGLIWNVNEAGEFYLATLVTHGCLVGTVAVPSSRITPGMVYLRLLVVARLVWPLICQSMHKRAPLGIRERHK